MRRPATTAVRVERGRGNASPLRRSKASVGATHASPRTATAWHAPRSCHALRPMLCLAKRWAENHSVRVETAMLKSRTHAKYRPQPALLAALLVGLLLSLQTGAADTARQGTQSTAL